MAGRTIFGFQFEGRWGNEPGRDVGPDDEEPDPEAGFPQGNRPEHLPFQIIFGRVANDDQAFRAQDNRPFGARAQLELLRAELREEVYRRVHLSEAQHRDVRRSGWRFVVAVGMLMFLVGYFRYKRLVLDRRGDNNVDEFPWDARPFTEAGLPYETVFFESTEFGVQELLRSGQETYIGDADQGYLSLLGSEFLSVRPSSMNSSCTSLYQSPHSTGPWKERRQSFCPDTSHSFRAAAPLESENAEKTPLTAYWTQREDTRWTSCLVLWKENSAEPSNVFAVDEKLDYCFLDEATGYTVCASYTDEHIYSRWSAWDSSGHIWSADLFWRDGLENSNYVLVRSPTTAGFAVLVHQSGKRERNPTIVIDLNNGKLYVEEFRKDGSKERLNLHADPFHDVFDDHGKRRLRSYFKPFIASALESGERRLVATKAPVVLDSKLCVP